MSFVSKVFSKTALLVGSVAILASSLVSAQSMIQNCKPGYVAITYDDGPNIYTSELVKLLDSNGVKATFFINGDNFLQLNDSVIAQEALKNAYNSGHQIASHTWSHQNLDEIDGSKFDSEIVKLEQIVQQFVGKRPAYIRPPYGAASETTVKKLNDKGYQVIEWSTDTKDYESHNTETEIEHVKGSFTKANLDNGFIILAHDVYEQTTTDLTKALIKYIKDEGFKFCTVAECVGQPAYK
ncbi:uncharacterized protein EV154DRAFT_465519 [Mucor mucedo]|uniref:uncharacterized protein n=1 Tax=Mucor mucedo TaxID=29922 RepID=UPI00222111E5|nr:uncharacterized protein EV154DRAFT_465519 [Mucor mucedo]KAI7890498.1 hypothetical protein EV154DRAFT_465519 [Mucor mucedo]